MKAINIYTYSRIQEDMATEYEFTTYTQNPMGLFQWKR